MHRESPLAVTFVSKPSLAILLMIAVLSTPGKCAWIPSGQSCSAFAPPQTCIGLRGNEQWGEQGRAEALFPAAVLLFSTPDQWARCAHRQQQQFEQCNSPVGPRHLQMHPQYLTQWRNYRSNKYASGEKNVLSYQIKLT